MIILTRRSHSPRRTIFCHSNSLCIRFSLIFSSYFILNTYIRIIQGLIDSIVKPSRRFYLLLSGFLRLTLGKNRIDLDQIEVSENRALLKLTAFLEHGSNYCIRNYNEWVEQQAYTSIRSLRAIRFRTIEPVVTC